MMLGIPLGLITANATEWFVHRYVLHGVGRNKESWWAFHWHEHHRECRRNAMLDPHYHQPVVGAHSQGKEALALAVGVASLLPLTPIAPFFVGTMAYSAINYYRVHKRSHLDAEWARENLSWHYDHHMGPDQNANWCVTRPWFDDLMGTRKPYVGTGRELKDRARRVAKAAAKAVKAKAREAAKVAKTLDVVDLEDAIPEAA